MTLAQPTWFSMQPTRITRLDALIERYDALLLDAYGVLVNLDGALPGAVALIDRLNALGKPYWVLSNTAARLPENAARRYRGFGLAIEPERILTSGMLLGPYFASQGLIGRRTRVLGPPDSVRYVELAGGVPVEPGGDFEVVVLADQDGFPFLETVDGLLSRLFAKLDAGVRVPLILPNPDLVYPKGGGWGITSGSVALMIEAALEQRYRQRDELRFVRLGKPHAALFEAAARTAGSRNLVMIGDQLETDIQGANDFGIDSALVAGGVAGRAPRLSGEGPRPTWLLTSLVEV